MKYHIKCKYGWIYSFYIYKSIIRKQSGCIALHVLYIHCQVKMIYTLYFQFGVNEKLSYEDFMTWSRKNSPHLFCGVHNWVYTILTGSKMPSEQVTTRVVIIPTSNQNLTRDTVPPKEISIFRG